MNVQRIHNNRCKFQYMLKSLQQAYAGKTMNVLSSLQVRIVEVSQI